MRFIIFDARNDYSPTLSWILHALEHLKFG